MKNAVGTQSLRVQYTAAVHRSGPAWRSNAIRAKDALFGASQIVWQIKRKPSRRSRAFEMQIFIYRIELSFGNDFLFIAYCQ